MGFTHRNVTTPLGEMLAMADENSLVALEFTEPERLDPQLGRLRKRLRGIWQEGNTPVLDQIERELADYYAGHRREFDVSIQLSGTEFQNRVWTELLKIPYGETRTYGQIAAQLGDPNVVRAVGMANGDNPLAIIVPCHRVIGADGSLTGYGGGLWRKQRLIELEQGQMPLI